MDKKTDRTHAIRGRCLTPHSPLPTPHSGFTLVELLVVITIIGILAALITVAAIGALKKAHETRTKAEINQISAAVDEYKNKTTAYPPNCQTDDAVLTGGTKPLDETGILNDLKRHMRQAFPRNQESDDLLLAMVGIPTTNIKKPPLGGITAGEAVVFWLGGFSSDPKYPISGDGGPSYPISAAGATTNRTQDPIESRKWTFPFDVSRLAPRASDGYFDEAAAPTHRYIEYPDPRNTSSTITYRRVNLWQYTPAKSEQPYLYFDTSRHPAGVVTSGPKLFSSYDPPAATALTGLGPAGAGLPVYAFKKQNPGWSESNKTTVPALTYVNPDKFQILHCGLDERWDDDSFSAFARMIPNGRVNDPGDSTANYLLFPAGPFVGDIADTIVNFISETRIEDAPKP